MIITTPCVTHLVRYFRLKQVDVIHILVRTVGANRF